LLNCVVVSGSDDLRRFNLRKRWPPEIAGDLMRG